jgi:hypothetical protein
VTDDAAGSVEATAPLVAATLVALPARARARGIHAHQERPRQAVLVFMAPLLAAPPDFTFAASRSSSQMVSGLAMYTDE